MAKGIRNVQIIGNLWPVCKKCRHIAQSHDEAGCTEAAPCPHCGKVDAGLQCSCKEYVGPTLEEFIRDYLTPEEAAYYSEQWKVPNAQLNK